MGLNRVKQWLFVMATGGMMLQTGACLTSSELTDIATGAAASAVSGLVGLFISNLVGVALAT